MKRYETHFTTGVFKMNNSESAYGEWYHVNSVMKFDRIIGDINIITSDDLP